MQLIYLASRAKIQLMKDISSDIAYYMGMLEVGLSQLDQNVFGVRWNLLKPHLSY